MTLRFRPLALLFVLFLAVALVRIAPFTPRTLFDAAEAEAGGGVVKQALFGGLLVVIAAVVLPRVRWQDVAVPWPVIALLAFALASLSWSAVPALGGRRLAQTALIAAALLLATMRSRPRDVLDLLRVTTIALAVATLAAGLLYPAAAIHQSGDPETSVIGAWRGIFYHKNLAGGVVALALVLSVDALIRERRWLTGLASIGIIALTLLLTRSKTSMLAAGVAIVILIAFRAANAIAGANPARAALLKLGVTLALLAALLVGWFVADLQSLVLDPESFTGRGQLWAAVGHLVAERPLLGHGYESVFQAGDASAMARISSVGWIRNAPHSHNGPLDLLVTIGAVGLMLYLAAMVADPWRRIAGLPDALRRAWQPTVAALLAFALVHSLMEGKMFSGEGLEWTLLVIVAGIAARLQALVRRAT